MAVSFVNLTSNSAAAVQSIDGTIPDDTQGQDVCFAFLSKSAISDGFATPAGWTLIANLELSTTGFEGSIYRRVLAGSIGSSSTGADAPGQTYTFNVSVAVNKNLQIVMAAFRGLTGAQADSAVTGNDSASTSSHALDASAIDPAGSALAIWALGSTSISCPSDPPTGYTQIYDPGRIQGSSWGISWAAVPTGSLGTITASSPSSFRGTKFVFAMDVAEVTTPTPGIATAAGISPTARAGATASAATATGTSPGARAAASPGTATASGNSPSSTTSDSAGLTSSSASEIPPGSSTSTPTTPGAATTVGISPTDGALDTTPTPGVAVATGISPTANATTGTAAASTAGISPLPTAVAGIGTATTQGISPSGATSVEMGTATAVGLAAAAAAALGVGTATTTGISPGELVPVVIPGAVTAFAASRGRVSAAGPGTVQAARGGSA